MGYEFVGLKSFSTVHIHWDYQSNTHTAGSRSASANWSGKLTGKQEEKARMIYVVMS
jgi:hypothetical protein